MDRDAGQYLGPPTTVLLEDGRTILAACPEGHGGGPIVRKRRVDGGRTWSERLPVPANWATSREAPTVHRVVDADGERRSILSSGLDPIRMASSEGDGRTWTPLAPIGDFGGIVRLMDNTTAIDCADPGVEVLPDGTIVATTYGHWAEGQSPYIVAVRFTLAELDELAKARAASSGTR